MQPEPYREPPRTRQEQVRRKDPAPWALPVATAMAFVVGAGAMALHLRMKSAKPEPETAAEAAPAPAPAPAANKCRSYAQWVAALETDPEDRLIADAKCLCSLAKGYMVMNPKSGIQPYKIFDRCPAGGTPRPLEPDAKLWKGSWIDEPGHTSCVCVTDIRKGTVQTAP